MNNKNGSKMGIITRRRINRGETSAPDQRYYITTFCSLITKLMALVDRLPKANLKDTDYTTAMSNWLDSCFVVTNKENTTSGGDGGDHSGRYTFRRTVSIRLRGEIITINHEVVAQTKNTCKTQWCKEVIQHLTAVEPQMESESGSMLSQSDKAGNTIVAGDVVGSSVSEIGNDLNILTIGCSSEPTNTYPELTDRWMALPLFTTSTSDAVGTRIAHYELPSSLYVDSRAANLLPFQQYVYSNMTVEMKFVVNAHRFGMGKLLVSSMPEPYNMDITRNGIDMCMSRPHIMLDLATHNDGTITVPFKYHRTFIKNISMLHSTNGVKPSQYASVSVHVLSKYSSPVGQPTKVTIRPYFRILSAQFTGMAQRFDLPKPQMEAIGEMVLEKGIHMLGKQINYDKPPDNERLSQVAPKPRFNFCSGKGFSDASSLALDHRAMTTVLPAHIYPDEPRSYYDLVRKWGLRGKFNWGQDTKPSFLWSSSLAVGGDSSRKCLAPIDYASAAFAFYSGTLEYRFDFVGNEFMNGAVMVSCEYGRKTESVTDSSSTYTKTFQVGKQRSFTMTAPWISDRVMRRCLTTPYEDSTKTSSYMGLYNQTSNFIKVRVVNPLVPISQVPTSMEVLVFVRGGEDFTFHCPIQRNMNISPALAFDQFPGPEYATRLTKGRLLKGDDSSEENETVKKKTFDPTTFLNSLQRGTQAMIHSVDESKVVLKETTKALKIPTDNSYTIRIGNDVFEASSDYKSIIVDGTQLSLLRMKNSEPGSDVFPQGDLEGDVEYDKTGTFKSRSSNFRFLQTVDDHMNFLDILRRPVCIMYNIELNVSDGYKFYIPLMPPTSQFGSMEDSAYNVPYTALCALSPQAHILDMFRMWRGGINYTIVVRGANKIVYVAQLPHNGMRFLGNIAHNTNSVTIGGVKSIPGCAGLPTEIICSSVNPTSTIYCPYNSENTWTLMQDADAKRNYNWRDKGDTNAGHLVITSEEKVNIDVWWAAADDFQIAGYMGIPGGIPRYVLLGDDNPIPQMEQDFLSCESEDESPILEEALTRKKAKKTKKQVMAGLAQAAVKVVSDPAVWVAAATNAIPVVGPALTVGSCKVALDDASAKLDDITRTATHLMTSTQSEITDLSQHGKETLSKLSAVAATGARVLNNVEDLVSYLSDKLSSLGQTTLEMTNTFQEYLFDIINCIVNRNWSTMGFTLIRVIARLCDKPLTFFASYMAAAKQMFTRESTVSEQADNSEEQISEGFWDKQKIEKIVGFVLGVFGLGLGVAIDESKSGIRTIVAKTLAAMTKVKGVGYINSVMRLVTMMYEVVAESFYHLLGYVNPEAKLLDELSSKSQLVRTFISESQVMLSEINQSALVAPVNRQRYWFNVIRAKQIQEKLLTCRMPAGNQLMSLCNQVLRAGNQKFSQLRCSPVRYEPFVVMVSGAPNVGKSHGTSRIIRKCLDAIGFRYEGNPIYQRISGVEFWNGYYDQPVVVFDEWLNIRDPQLITKQLADWFGLKSSIPFTPNQAAIEEKKMNANPLIVFVNCNDAFPDSTLASHADDRTLPAIYRRRDLLFDVQRKREYIDVDLNTLSEENSAKYVHLDCRRYMDVQDHRSKSAPFSHGEMEQMIVDEFVKYHAREMKHVKRRMDDIMLHMNSSQAFKIIDPFSIFYSGSIEAARKSTQTGFMPSEIFEVYLTEIQNKMDELRVDDSTTQAQGFVDILEWIQGSYASLNKRFTTWTNSGNAEPDYVCSVCNEVNTDVWTCSQSCENPHYTCNSCKNHIVETTGTYRCPVCRDESFGRVYDSKMLMSLLYAIRNPSARPEFWKNFGKMLWWVNAIQALSFFVRSPTMETATMMHGMFVFGQLHAVTSAQGDDEMVYRILPRHFKPQCKPVEIPYNINTKYAKNPMIANASITCCHEQFVEDLKMEDFPCSAIYSQKQFLWATETDWMPIPLVCSPDCELMKEWDLFIRKYLDTNKKNCLKHLAECNYDKSLFCTTYPEFCWPTWLPDEQSNNQDQLKWYERLDNPIVKKILKFLGLGAALVAALGALKWIWGMMKPHEQLISSGSTPVRHFNRSVVKVASSPVAQMSADDAIQTKVARNYFTILCIKGDVVIKQLTGVGIKGRVGLMPRHYYSWLMENKSLYDEVWVERSLLNSVKTHWVLNEQTFLVSETSDICVAYMPPSFPPFQSITKHFVTDADLESALTRSATLLEIPNRTCPTVMARTINIRGFRPSQRVSATNGSYETKHNLVYEFSKAGACGSMALLNGRVRPIISMHIAGSKYEGFGVLISQEAMADIPDLPKVAAAKEMVIPEWAEPVEQCSITFDEDTSLLPVFSLPKHMVPYSPSETAIRKSAVSDILPWDTKQQTAILHKKDPRYVHGASPLVDGCAKMGKLTRNFPLQQLEEVFEIERINLQKMKPLIVNPKKLSYEQAVGGLESEYYTPMKLETSMGYTVLDGKLVTKDGNSKKRGYMTIERDEHGSITDVKIDERLKDLCDQEYAQRIRGERPFVGFISTLKDERRNAEKVVKLGGTRVVDAAPASYVIAMRQSFLHFSAAYMSERLKLPHAVGINMTGPEVTTMIEKLRNVGSKFITLDYSNFGPGLNSEVSWYTDQLMKGWTMEHVDGVNELEMDLLLEEGLTTNHVIYDSVYQSSCGSPSGSPITVIKNSMVDNFYLKLAWSKIYDDNIFAIHEALRNTDYEQAGKWVIFDKLICIFVYGDDVIMSVDDNIAPWWNAITITDFFSQYGITATDASKTGKIVPYTTLQEASFLKHYFSLHPWRNEWMAALSEDNIKDIPHWIYKGPDDPAATRVNCEAALRHYFPYGKTKFAEFRDILNEALIKIGEEPLVLTWNELDMKRYENGFDGFTLEKKPIEFY